MLDRKRHDDAGFSPVMRSPAMRRLDQVLQTVAPKDVTLTLLGESGSGKEVLARRAHALSPRTRGPFVPINCAAIPEALFESELFGHERGAFTSAGERVKGKVEAAAGGTLFLDEIGELPVPMQAKLLRFLETRRFMRVGGTAKIDADVRVVVATLRPLDEEVSRGRFRADLFYRIQGMTLQIPPLRERRADIAPLLSAFSAQLSARHGVAPPRLTREAKALLLRYDWPGNVRELRNVVETWCLLRGGRRVRVADLPEAMRAGAGPAEASGAPPSGMRVTLDDGLDAIVQQVIEAALRDARGDKRRAAERLKISVRTIQRHVADGAVLAPAAPRSARSRGGVQRAERCLDA